MAFSRSLLLTAASGLALAFGVSSAFAGGFAVREQSATAQGLSFAGAAAGSGGLSSMFWNPATVTMSPGFNSEYHASLILPDATVTPVAPTPTIALGGSGNIGQDAVVPASYTGYQLTDNVWLGLANTAPFGLVTKPRDVWAGQTYSRSSRVYSLNFNPVVGIKVTDWLSVGFGPTVEYLQVRLKNAAGVGPVAPSVILEGDDVGVGMTAGATITPMPGTTIGIGYRSTVRHELQGSLRTPVAFIPARINLNLPDQVTLGLRQALLPNLALDLGFEWTNWSRAKIPAITSALVGVPVAAFPLRYQDGFFYSVGLEYAWNPQWAFRVGVAYEQSPIDVNNRSTRLPDSDRVWASLGASYKWSEKLQFDAAYSHIFRVGSNGIRILPGDIAFNGLPFVATTDTSADIFSLALKYRWDDPQVAQAAPIVRKY